MLVNRKSSKGTKQTKLKKSNALKMNHTIKNCKNADRKQLQSNTQENIASSYDWTKPKGFDFHFASTSELIYTPFRKDYHLPPHLNSSNIQRTIFRAENPNWQIRPSSARKYDYDQLYQTNELKYSVFKPSRRWSQTKSKIKSYLDEDRSTLMYFSKPAKLTCCQRQKHPDDDLSEQSSVEPQQE